LNWTIFLQDIFGHSFDPQHLAIMEALGTGAGFSMLPPQPDSLSRIYDNEASYLTNTAKEDYR
jgi:hypothetical protein